jgi:hypothetical protein
VREEREEREESRGKGGKREEREERESLTFDRVTILLLKLVTSLLNTIAKRSGKKCTRGESRAILSLVGSGDSLFRFCLPR